MKKPPRSNLVSGLALLLATALLATATALSQDLVPGAAASSAAGQSATLLSNGLFLLLGGNGLHGATASAYVEDPQTGAVTTLANHLQYARAWQSATVLSDGTVAIIGGVGKSGKTVAVVESFDPPTQTFGLVSVSGITPRSHHTATLLSDGEVLIVGGLSASGQTLHDAQLWNPRTGQVAALASTLSVARHDHTARLQADGSVLIQGGVDQGGNKINSTEVYDPKLESFAPVSTSENNAGAFFALGASSPGLAGMIPADGATGVPVNTIISLRFSEAMQVETIDPDTVRLTGPDGNVAATIVAAEGGMLAFVNPDSQLAANATYTVTVDGVVARDGTELAKTSFAFTTASGGSSLGTTAGNGASSATGGFNSAGIWIPTNDWQTHLPPSSWQSLPPLRAPRGVTALSGQVLTIDGNPLPNVTLQVGNRKVLSDGSGRFLITGLIAGKGVLLIDGSSANHAGKTFGIFQAGQLIEARITNVLSYTIWMPVLDMADAVTLPVPTASQTVVTNPLMPGLELHIPGGTTITDINGKVVRTVSMTPVPLDRPPFPLAAGVDVQIYFTVQPGGAQLWSAKGKWAWAQLVYPNLGHLPPGNPANFWNYDPEGSGWYVYGKGAVSADGKSVVPNPGVGFYEFTGAMQQNFIQRSPTNSCQSSPARPSVKLASGGIDPVDCSTGIFIHEESDLHLADVIPIDLRRST